MNLPLKRNEVNAKSQQVIDEIGANYSNDFLFYVDQENSFRLISVKKKKLFKNLKIKYSIKCL